MTETKQREAHRMACKHYGKASGLCCDKSHYYSKGILTIAVEITCTPDCDCARMRRYDKMKNQE